MDARGIRAPEGSLTVPERMAGASDRGASNGAAARTEPETKNKLKQHRQSGIYRPYRRLATRGTSQRGRAAPVRVKQHMKKGYTKVADAVKRYIHSASMRQPIDSP